MYYHFTDVRYYLQYIIFISVLIISNIIFVYYRLNKIFFLSFFFVNSVNSSLQNFRNFICHTLYILKVL